MKYWCHGCHENFKYKHGQLKFIVRDNCYNKWLPHCFKCHKYKCKIKDNCEK